MMCHQKVRQDFCQILKFTLNQVDISAPQFCEALYSPMIVTVGLLGPLPRSDNTLQATYTLGRFQTSMMCGQQKCS